ncbi:winged helix-turn-helix domain-containing protein [Amycolatopsis dongchuanensis]
MLANHLSDRIESGELPENRPPPSKCRLAYEYEVSIGTVRHAIRILRDRGLIIPVPGKGFQVRTRQKFGANG